MKILAIERETSTASGDRMKSYLKAEASQVWALYQANLIREIYFSSDQHNAVLILECANVEEARQILNQLPLVVEGYITFELIPLVPYSGFARLFAG